MAILNISNCTGVFSVGKTITGNTSGATAKIVTISGNTLNVNMLSSAKMFIDTISITNRKRIGESITESETKYTAIIDDALELINVLDKASLEKYEPKLREYTADINVMPDYKDIISISFEELKAALNHKGIDYIDIRQTDSDTPKFKVLHIYKTLELLYSLCSKEPQDLFWIKSQLYYEKFTQAIQNITYDRDYDKNGIITSDEINTNNRYLRFVR